MNTALIAIGSVAAVIVALLFVVRWAMRASKREGASGERADNLKRDNELSKRAADIAAGPVDAGERLRRRLRARRERRLRQATVVSDDSAASGDE